jgi:hypothetical protein
MASLSPVLSTFDLIWPDRKLPSLSAQYGRGQWLKTSAVDAQYRGQDLIPER